MIEVLDSGFYTSIQDEGRKGYRHLGVPVSGAMDQKAFELGRLLLGRKNEISTMECTLIGPRLRFQEPCNIVLTGANMKAKLNQKLVQNNTILNVRAADELCLKRVEKGLRTYIHINKSLITEKVLGSTSFYFPLTKSSIIEKGDHLFWLKSESTLRNFNSKIKWDDSYIEYKELSVYKGPEFKILTKEQAEQLFKMPLKISNQNRMGCRLKSSLEIKPDLMLSQSMRPGTVQLTPSGTLLIAGFDGQVSGGYPRILQLTDEALNVLAQKIEGTEVFFKLSNTLL